MDYITAKEKAIKYIGISKKTSFEVSKKLKTIGAEQEVIDKVIEYLEELEYIDDVEYVELYIKQNVKLLKYSVYELKQKLLQKGIKASIIESKFESNLPLDYETIVINKIISSKLRDYDENKRKEYLYRRGFKLDNLGEIYE